MKIFAGTGIILLSLCSASNVCADICPPTSVFRHMVGGGDWVVSNEYNAQGWYVSQTPQAQDAIVRITDNSKLKVILDANNDPGNYVMECEYSLDPSLPHVILRVFKNAAQPDPANNTQFKKTADKHYVCVTTISTPGYCSSVQN
jgi:hypothetical protein